MRLLTLSAILAVFAGSGLALVTRAHVGERPLPKAQIPVAAYDRVEPGVTRARRLAGLGFDLGHAQRLSFLALLEQFQRGDSIDFDALDPAVRDCFLGRARCDGYSFPLADMPGTTAVVVIAQDRVATKLLTGRILTSAASGPSAHY